MSLFTPIAVPLVNGARHSFTSIELKMAGQIFLGFKSIDYNRTRSRTKLWGAHPDPIGKTQGVNDYTASVELYFLEFMAFLQAVAAQGAVGAAIGAAASGSIGGVVSAVAGAVAGGGAGYGDAFFDITVTYSNGISTPTVDEIIGCTLDTTDASNGQGSDGTTRKMDLNPLKIRFGQVDDVASPLLPTF